jgi:CheY-like chemotaxis protein/anti-sigma regulatory factor (Ser/Thr protein kinase)
MSHEIRTPMTAILGYAAMLRELGDLEKAPVERIDALNTICRNGDHLLTLINDILDLSKLEAGKMTVERVRCAPLDVVRDVIDLMAGRAEQKGLSLTLHPEGRLPETIASDPTRLRQILVNLVGNAIKFTDAGGVTVAVRCAVEASTLTIAVRDTGIGLDETQRRGLFEPFTQADSSTSRRFGGTGLGLTISRRFAELLGGGIDVESESGAGSTFTVTITTGPLDGVPLVETTTAAHPVAAAPSGAVAPPERAGLRGRCVLVAEDTPDNQRLIRYHLEKAGIEVELVENGRDAVERAAASVQEGPAYDAVLMDIQMPEMDGYAACRRMRDLGFTAPVIALTASTMRGDRERALEAGMVEHVAKPIDPDELLDALERAIGDAPDATDAGATGDGFDRRALESRFGSSELLHEVAGLFLEQCGGLMDDIREAADAGDLAELGRRAHALRGSAGNFAYDAVTEAARRVERIAGAEDRAGVAAAVDTLGQRLATMRAALEALVDGRK